MFVNGSDAESLSYSSDDSVFENLEKICKKRKPVPKKGKLVVKLTLQILKITIPDRFKYTSPILRLKAPPKRRHSPRNLPKDGFLLRSMERKEKK
jgi:hypothetical protein